MPLTDVSLDSLVKEAYIGSKSMAPIWENYAGGPLVPPRDMRVIFALCVLQIALGNLIPAIVDELNPVSGLYYADDIVWSDGSAAVYSGFESPLVSIDNGVAFIGEYWSCGVVKRTYSKGTIRVHGDTIDIVPDPSRPDRAGRLQIGPDHELLYQTLAGGQPAVIRFERAENAHTICDWLFNWR